MTKNKTGFGPNGPSKRKLRPHAKEGAQIACKRKMFKTLSVLQFFFKLFLEWLVSGDWVSGALVVEWWVGGG